MAKNKFTAKEIINALVKSKGFVSITAKNLGCDAKTVHNYINKNTDIQEALADIRNERHDFVESKMMAGINEGNVALIIFYAKTQMKDRGYSDRTEYEQQNNVRVEVINFD